MPQARIKAIADKHDPANQFVLRLADNRQRKRGAFDGQAPHHSSALPAISSEKGHGQPATHLLTGSVINFEVGRASRRERTQIEPRGFHWFNRRKLSFHHRCFVHE